MNKYNNKTQICPVENTLHAIGKKWTVLIIRDLLGGTKRFGQLLSSLVGISPRSLSARLTDLEESQIIKKKIYPEVPPKVEYTLTRKGRELSNVLKQMEEWGKKYQ